MTPFKVLYGRDPLGLAHYEQGISQVEAVDDQYVAASHPPSSSIILTLSIIKEA